MNAPGAAWNAEKLLQAIGRMNASGVIYGTGNHLWRKTRMDSAIPEINMANGCELAPGAPMQPAAFGVIWPPAGAPVSPLVFNSPHSGSDYPAEFVAASQLDLATLRRSEDCFIDDLFADAPAHGAPLLRAFFPRAYVDVNREPFELDPGMFTGSLPAHVNTRSLRAAGGLGTIARVVADGKNIYREKLSFAEAERRITALYRPYHAALRALLESTARRAGAAVLIDCHSMPSTGAAASGPGERPAEIILGDRFGASCSPLISAAVETALRELGYQVVRNVPYAGGHITDTYGLTGGGWHALQIEISRALYMDEAAIVPGPGYARLRADMSVLIARLTALLTPEMLAGL